MLIRCDSPYSIIHINKNIVFPNNLSASKTGTLRRIPLIKTDQDSPLPSKFMANMIKIKLQRPTHFHFSSVLHPALALTSTLSISPKNKDRKKTS